MKNFVIMFDLDGTLLNTDLLIKKSFEYVFHKYLPHYKVSDEEYLSFMGPSLNITFERFFPSNMVDELIQAYRDYNLPHHQDYVTIYPTVIETLQELKKLGYPMAVVTTKKKDAAMLGLDMFHITDYFDVIIGMEDVKEHKPSPEGIQKVMHILSCKQGVMIGDNVSDIMAGKNAGVYTIGVNWTPKGTEDIKKSQPDLMIDQMYDILKFIKERG